LLHVFHGSRRGNIAARRDILDKRSCPRMGDVDNDIVIFNPLLAFEASPVDRIFIALVKDGINTMKPRI
jgi:hypothetical protein